MTNLELEEALKAHFKLDVETITTEEQVPTFLNITQTVVKATKYVVAKFDDVEISRVPIDVEFLPKGN